MQKKLLLCVTLAVGLLACEKQNRNVISATDSGLVGTPTSGGGVTPTVSPSLTGLTCNSRWNYANHNFAGLSASVAKMMATNYATINQPKLMIEGNIPDSRSMWLSLETMKAFIWKIEQAICNKGCTNNLNVGVRIYFGRYPLVTGMTATPDLSGLPTNYQQHHTAFVVPTYQDPANPNVQWDFDPWHWGNNTCRPTSFRSWFGMNEGHNPFGTDKSLILTLSEQQFFPSFNTNTIMNHGSLIPPDPSEGTGF
jgi:hypothetical protein